MDQHSTSEAGVLVVTHGVCPVCHGIYSLCADGTLRCHGYARQKVMVGSTFSFFGVNARERVIEVPPCRGSGGMPKDDFASQMRLLAEGKVCRL